MMMAKKQLKKLNLDQKYLKKLQLKMLQLIQQKIPKLVALELVTRQPDPEDQRAGGEDHLRAEVHSAPLVHQLPRSHLPGSGVRYGRRRWGV